MGAKVCVITGASSGIGERTAFDLATEGNVVVLAARREDRLKEVLAGLPGEGHSYFVTDVSDHDSVRSLADHVRSNHSRCDALINNAGFSEGGAFRGPDSIPDIAKMMDTNFYGAVFCTAELLPLLEAAAPSSVVNVASIAGRVGLGNASGYSASKFALVGWSEGLRYELEPRGISVGLVEPGPIPTEGFPQSDLRGHRLLRYAIGTTEDVSKAIRAVIDHRKAKRAVPRFYHLAQFPRLIVPPLHRWVMKALVNRRV